MNPHFEETNLKIFTLNCWGLRFVSEHRQRRIKLIAQHLVEHNYDVVFLQEIWCQSDFDYIRTTAKSKYRFAHMFKNASILGTSGLAILTRWIPNVFHFHPFSVNGSPFRPLHGDWFTSKGVGYVRVELDCLSLHLFCTHMHAQYDLNERINDQYSVHRICQSYETAKFINLMTSCRSDTLKTKELIILAGDMNASSKELPYRLLVSLTGLKDCYKCKTDLYNEMRDSIEADDFLFKEQQSHDETDYYATDDEDLITCGHRDNTFTQQSIKKDNSAKRIDFILFKFLNKKRKNGYSEGSYVGNKDKVQYSENSICKVEHIKISCKDESGLSFSDHQPVVANLKIRYFAPNATSKIDDLNSELNSELNSKLNSKLESELNSKLNSELNSTEETDNSYEHNRIAGDSITVIAGIKNCQLDGDGYDKITELHDKNDLGCGDGSNSLRNEFSFIEELDKFEEVGLLSGKPKSKSNILLEVTEAASKVAKNGPLQLKQIVSNAIKSKFEPKPFDKSHLLDMTRYLLENYVKDNQLTPTYCFCLLGLAITVVSLLVFGLLFIVQMTTFEVLFLVLIIAIIIGLSAFLKFLTHRHERNAVNAILNDIKKEILFN